MRRLIPLAGLAVLVLLAGCGQRTGTTGSAGTGPSAPSTPAASTTTPTATTPTSPTSPTGTRQPPRQPTVVLDGVAQRGVEPGCVVFRAAGRQYVLLGAEGATLSGVPMGVPIRVRAAALTGVFSYCQQGTTLQVLEISRR